MFTVWDRLYRLLPMVSYIFDKLSVASRNAMPVAEIRQLRLPVTPFLWMISRSAIDDIKAGASAGAAWSLRLSYYPGPLILWRC